jgi:hypothetical protein
MENKNSNILSVLAECKAACNNCLTSCLDEKDVKMMAKCIKLDLDCAKICEITADFISRQSDHAQHLIKECIEICTKCAQECVKYDMEHCQRCAVACKKCAEVCKNFEKELVH